MKKSLPVLPFLAVFGTAAATLRLTEDTSSAS